MAQITPIPSPIAVIRHPLALLIPPSPHTEPTIHKQISPGNPPACITKQIDAGICNVCSFAQAQEVLGFEGGAFLGIFHVGKVHIDWCADGSEHPFH